MRSFQHAVAGCGGPVEPRGEVFRRIIVCVAVFSIGFFAETDCSAATSPYYEDFEGYATGDTAVTNFTEMAPAAWTIVSPGFSGKAYENAISVTSSGIGVAAGENSSAVVSLPGLSAASYSVSTSFRIDTLTLTGADPKNTATIGLTAQAADATPAASGADRYQVSYYLDDDGSGHPTGRLYLTERNMFFGDSLNELSTGTLPVILGDIYTLTLTGIVSSGTLTLTATLVNTTTSGSISVSDIDSANLLGGSYFGYFNHVRVEDGGTVALNADFDHFSVVPEPPATAFTMVGAIAICLVRPVLRRRQL